jgi:imidazolonepropionase-like amidohydrolase
MRCVRLGSTAVTAAVWAACSSTNIVDFVRFEAPVLALTHVRVIDGTGAPGVDDRTVIVRDGRIDAVGPFNTTGIPSDARVIDLSDRTLIPGLVGMHDHLFYELQHFSSQPSIIPAQAAFAKLYLAAGVTTIRTTGAADFAGDLRMKERVDDGREPGPEIYVTSPYLHAQGSTPNPDRIAQQVAEWADRGATSFKAYTSLRAPELRATIQAAHQRGLHVTGHLCAVGFREAAALGIDSIEHGLPTDTEFYSAKRPDVCPDQTAVLTELLRLDVNGAEIRRTIADLVKNRVALTSTLAIYESFTGKNVAFDADLLSTRIRKDYLAVRDAYSNDVVNRGALMWAAILKKEMEFERAFVAAGGRLMAGVDPTGWGGVMAGVGDHRQLELLVEAGLSPEMAIKVATSNGATFLDPKNTFGTIAPGQSADLIVLRGDPSVRISAVRTVELVFKDGIAYDPAKLMAAAEGTVGEQQFARSSGGTKAVLISAALGCVAVLLARLGSAIAKNNRRRQLPRQ